MDSKNITSPFFKYFDKILHALRNGPKSGFLFFFIGVGTATIKKLHFLRKLSFAVN